jgi:hypothetical protein
LKLRSITLCSFVFLAFSVFLALRGAALAQGKRDALPAEQSHFSAEDAGVQRPMAIPKDVIAILTQDDLVRTALKNQKLPVEKLPLSWFSAAGIHLGNANETDVVVMAEKELHGANATTFWIFRSTSKGHQLVLTAPAHDLKVKNVQWLGYREIGLVSMTANRISTVLCRFDGRKYAQYKSTTKDIR